MKLSAPIFQLKRRAKQLAQELQIPLSKALDQIAREEGFSSWSLLASKESNATPAAKLLRTLQPGEMLLVAARPGQGKTLLSLSIAAEAIRQGNQGILFTLEYSEREVRSLLKKRGITDAIELDCSDDICADHICEQLKSAPPGAVAIIDYLQLLDQRRENPPLAEQVQTLRTFAQARQVNFVFISQVDRSFDPTVKPMPDLTDIRLPNPIDLKLFDRACFLHGGEIRAMAINAA